MARPHKGQPLLRDFIADYFRQHPNKRVRISQLVNAGKKAKLSSDASYYKEQVRKIISGTVVLETPLIGELRAIGRSDPSDEESWCYDLVEAAEPEPTPESEPDEPESEEDSSRPIDPNEEVILRWYLMDLATVAIIDGRQSYQNLLDVAKEVHRDKRNDSRSVARWIGMNNDERLLYIQEIAGTLRERFDEYNSHSYSKMLNYTKRRK